MNFNVFDGLIVALPVVFLLIGFIRTPWRELISLVGVAVGAAAGAVYGGRVADLVGRVLPDRELAEVIGYLAILAAGWAAAEILGAGPVPRETGMRSTGGRILALLFGACKGGVLDMALVWLVAHHIKALQTLLGNAMLTGSVNDLISFLASHNPL